LKRRPSRRKKKARKGASSSDGVQAMMPSATGQVALMRRRR
jgi:hypothetical protein